MSNLLFVLPSCNLCAEAELAVIQANATLPISEKIQMINIMSNRPELALLAKFHNSNNPSDWAVPTLFLEEKGVKKVFGSYVKTNNKHRVIIRSVLDKEHLLEYIRTNLGYDEY